MLIQATLETKGSKNVTKKRRPTHHIDIVKVPYHVIVVNNGYFCSGSLVGSQIVIAPARCVVGCLPSETLVKVGAQTATTEAQILVSKEIIIHEYYELHNVLDNDIAILYLEKRVLFRKRVNMVVIRSPHVPYWNSTILHVSGWGTSDNGTNTYTLVSSEMEMLPIERCSASYGIMCSKSTFCAHYKSTNCLTDAGSPATLDGALVGMAITVTSCIDDSDVVVFTNISFFYRWIHKKTQFLYHKYYHEPNGT